MRYLDLTDVFSMLRMVNSSKKQIKKASEPDIFMSLPLIILALGSIYIGFLSKEMFLGLGTDFWNNSVFVKPSCEANISSFASNGTNLLEAEYLTLSEKQIPLLLTVLGGLLAFLFNQYFVKTSYTLASEYFYEIYSFLSFRWYYDKLLNSLISYPSYYLGYNLLQTFDKGLLELLSVFPLGLNTNLKKLFNELENVQSGLIYHYALIMIVSVICCFAVIIKPDLFWIVDSRIQAILFLTLILF